MSLPTLELDLYGRFRDLHQYKQTQISNLMNALLIGSVTGIGTGLYYTSDKFSRK
ncbi:predicted protein [Sclerotinia sclerotiorum 1980 UF-70]|uniref:Uncharacterized protein n=1 Tax=Sclerotinia sclerotiorum (strain ATCC 18683 / 1980 / Ss-1) TaxID=665079 RepID=A7EMQ0_SCLS1|nr:predicted protein [Sclerotinia sclerotiorum 1980 UF-70]EDO04116.1 predicted protein [Sclerotinia sclerotiorum 1980 UF-70]